MYAENCDKAVLKRILKQLWRIVMKSLERNIVLPPIEKVSRGNVSLLNFHKKHFTAKGKQRQERGGLRPEGGGHGWGTSEGDDDWEGRDQGHECRLGKLNQS